MGIGGHGRVVGFGLGQRPRWKLAVGWLQGKRLRWVSLGMSMRLDEADRHKAMVRSWSLEMEQ